MYSSPIGPVSVATRCDIIQTWYRAEFVLCWLVLFLKMKIPILKIFSSVIVRLRAELSKLYVGTGKLKFLNSFCLVIVGVLLISLKAKYCVYTVKSLFAQRASLLPVGTEQEECSSVGFSCKQSGSTFCKKTYLKWVWGREVHSSRRITE